MAKFYRGDRVKVGNRKGTVESKAGNWDNADEHGFYFVRLDGARHSEIVHESKLAKA